MYTERLTDMRIRGTRTTNKTLRAPIYTYIETNFERIDRHRNSERVSSGDGASSPGAAPVYTKILLTWAPRTRSLTSARALDDAINREARGASTAGSSFYVRERGIVILQTAYMH